jgi:hypothetical protein
MEDADDLDTIAAHPVGKHVPRPRHDQLSGACDPAWTTKTGPLRETLDGVEERRGDSVGCVRIVARDVGAQFFEMRDRAW